ncbi:MAG TPA: hypothetical protein VGB03_00685 [Acidimicrobiales bacterium]
MARSRRSSVVRLLRWLGAPAEDDSTSGRCPVCRRKVTVAPNHLGGTHGAGLWIPRPVSELVGACSDQHGTDHTDAEIAAARAENPWR